MKENYQDNEQLIYVAASALQGLLTTRPNLPLDRDYDKVRLEYRSAFCKEALEYAKTLIESANTK